MVALFEMRFEMCCLRDLAQTSDADLQYLTRQGWIMLIVVAIPLGGIVYLYARKTLTLGFVEIG